MPNLIDRLRVNVMGRRGGANPSRPEALGEKSDPILTCNFTVRIANIGVDFNLTSLADPDRVGFARVSGVSSEITTKDVVQGSSPVIEQVPVGIKYGKAVFERGVARSATAFALLSWYEDVKALIAGNYSDDQRRRMSLGLFSDVPYFIKRRNVIIDTPVDHRAYTRSVITKTRRRPIAGKTYEFKLQPRHTVGVKGTDGDISALVTTLVDAWPVKVEFGGLDANKSDVWIYRMEMLYTGILREYV